MKKVLWAVTLVLLPLSAAFAADGPQVQQDHAFLKVLAVQQSAAPMSPAPTACATQVSSASAFCSGVYCNNDTTCWASCPGGVGASYCNRLQHVCLPY